jgi:hypothetical protein
VVDMVGEAIAFRVDDAFPPEVALHDHRVNRQPVQVAFAEKLSHYLLQDVLCGDYKPPWTVLGMHLCAIENERGIICASPST